METQKIADNESSKFATNGAINDQNNTDYGEGNEDSTTVKFKSKVIKSNLCDYLDTYILVTGNITATGGDADTRVAFKNCVPFTKYITYIRPCVVDLSFIVTSTHQKIKALFCHINFDYATDFVKKCFVFFSILLLLTIKKEKKNTH